MKVAVTGAGGMLGHDMLRALEAMGHEPLPLTREDFDLADEALSLQEFPEVDAVINCAAYTKVDDAETHEREAYAVNMEGPLKLAQLCRQRGLRYIHFSTDYVFDGEKPGKYTERDIPNPINIYGASKLAGEKAIRGEGGNFLILRIQSLFGVHGRNFVEAILEKARAGEELKVVHDQVSAPTYSLHVAAAAALLLPSEKTGLLHVASTGECSWYEFACEILKQTGLDVPITPVPSEAFPRPATRPRHSVLDNHWYAHWTDDEVPTWREGLVEYLNEKGHV